METSYTILIVDDEPLVRETLEALLFDQGYNFAFAGGGAEALQKVEQVNPDLILLDVMMPDMDGFEVCRRLKRNEQWQHIPIILVTALIDPHDLAQGIDAGADDFLSKPVNRIEMRARVRSMLRIKRQYNALQKQQQALESALHLNEMFSQVIAQHLEALEVLHSTGLQMMDNLNMDYILDLVVQTIFELFPEANGCAMHLLSDDEKALLPVVISIEDRTKIVYPKVGIEELAQRSTKTGKAIIIADAKSAGIQPAVLEMRALLMVPIMDNKMAFGTLTIYSQEPNVFEERHQHILLILANQAAIAIKNAKFFREKERQKDEERWVIRSMFQRYVSPAVVERLVDGREDLELGGKRQEITVLFADIRGFTTFSEKQSPEQLVEVLNKYLALAVDAIMAEEGTLDKFMGDAVMAIFNAPLPQPDGTLRAVRAALAMQQAITHYNAETDGHQSLSFGIGIHRGQAVVGNIGTAQQMNYTAIGDTVNLAKRLQENSNGDRILLSQAAYDVIKNKVTTKNLGPLTVKGRNASENVYELIALTKPLKDPS